MIQATFLDSKGRTPDQHYEAWIAWRKGIIDKQFPERCSCRIGKSIEKQFKKTKCCQVMSCGMAIKNSFVTEHRETCKVCSDVTGVSVSSLPPIGEPCCAKDT